MVQCQAFKDAFPGDVFLKDFETFRRFWSYSGLSHRRGKCVTAGTHAAS